MRCWLSASLRLGRCPTYVELATAPRIMRRWLSVSLRLGRRSNICGAGNSTTDYATLVVSVAPSWPMPNICGAGNSATDYATLGCQCCSVLADAQHMWSWQQHHGLCDAGFQRCSALTDAQHMWSWQQHHGSCILPSDVFTFKASFNFLGGLSQVHQHRYRGFTGVHQENLNFAATCLYV